MTTPVAAAADVSTAGTADGAADDNILLLRQQDHQWHRSLTQGGDFAELNSLLSSAVVSLPSVTVSQNLMTLSANNVACRSFSIGDVRLQSESAGGVHGNAVRVALEVEELDASCSFDYSYSGMLFFSGGGWADVVTADNAASVVLDLSTSSPSHSLSKYTPSRVEVISCVPRASISSMTFHGGIEGFILNALEGMLRRRIAEEMGRKMCQTLRSWSEGGAREILSNFGSTIDGYISQGWGTIDPLWSEKAMAVPARAELLEWNDPEVGNVGRWLRKGLDEGTAYLRSSVPDSSASGGSAGGMDMNANVLLREHALNQERALDVVLSDVPFLGDGGRQQHQAVDDGTLLLWEGTDRLSTSSISLEAVRVRGLDTMRRFDPLDTLGSHTFRSRLSWSRLSFEIDLVISLRPSTLADSVIKNPGEVPPVTEHVTVRFALSDIEAELALLLAIDEALYSDVHLISVLDSAKILPCLLTGVHDLRLSSLSVKVGSVAPPTLEGFVGPGLDRLGGEFAATFARLYMGTMLTAMPGFFRNDVREMAENWVRKAWRDNRADYGECLRFSNAGNSGTDDGMVDLRDLFLPPSEAVAAGASGASPYGDLVSSHLVTLMRDEMLALSDDEDGLPLINSRFVRPFTESLSGVEGALHLTSLEGGYMYEKKDNDAASPTADEAKEGKDLDLAGAERAEAAEQEEETTQEVPSMYSSLVDSFHLGLSSSSILNVDTVADPLTLLHPTSPTTITNSAVLGVPSRPLTFKTKLTVAAKGGDLFQEIMRNAVEITAKVPSSTLRVDFGAALDEELVMGLPLKYADDVHCWLATILPSMPPSSSGEASSPTNRQRRRRRAVALGEEEEPVATNVFRLRRHRDGDRSGSDAPEKRAVGGDGLSRQFTRNTSKVVATAIANNNEAENESSHHHHHHHRDKNYPPRPGLDLTRFTLTLPSSLSVDAKCQSCTTNGLSASLPRVLSAFADAGWSDAVRPRLELTASKLADISWDELMDAAGRKLLERAPKLCPYREEFDPEDLTAAEVEWSEEGPWWMQVMDAVDWDGIVLPKVLVQLGMAAAIWAGEAVILVLASTYASDDDGDNVFDGGGDPLAGQLYLDDTTKDSGDVAFLNFMEPEGDVGELIGMAMEEVREYVSEDVEVIGSSNNLRANMLIRDSILHKVDSDGGSGGGGDHSNRTNDGDHKAIYVVHGTPGGDHVLFDKFGASLTFDRAEVRGLDTLSAMNVFEALGPQTLRNGLTFEELSVSVNFNVTTGGGGGSSGGDGRRRTTDEAEAEAEAETMPTTTLTMPTMPTTERMILRLGARDVSLTAALLLALDLDELSSIELGGVRDTSNVLPCALSQIANASLTQLAVTVGHLDTFYAGGEFVPGDVAAVTSEAFESMTDDVRRAVPRIFGSTVRDAINSVMGRYRREGTACEWQDEDSVGGGDIDVEAEAEIDRDNDFIDFRDLFLPPSTALEYGGTGTSPYGDTLLTMFNMVDETLLRIDKPSSSSLGTNNDTGATESKINELIGSYTQSQSGKAGSVSIATEDAAMDGNVTLALGLVEAVARVAVWDVRVENLDSVGEPLELLRPVRGEPRLLNSTVSFGVGAKPLRLAAKAMVSLTDGADMRIHNELNLAIELSEASVQFGILLLLSEKHMFSYPIRDVVNVYCWLVTLLASPLDTHGNRLEGQRSATTLAHHNLSVGDLDLRVDCTNCSSPYFGDFVSMLYAPPGKSSNSSAGDGMDDSGRGDSDRDSTGFVNDWADYGKQFLAGDLLRDRILFDAAKQCPHNDAFDPNATASDFFTRPLEFGELKKAERDRRMMLFNVFSAITAGLLFLVGGMATYYIRRRNRIWIESLSNENRLLLERHRREEKEREDHLNAFTESMARSECIPKRRRIFVPVALLADLGLFLGGHLGILSTVNVDAELAGEQFSIYRFLEFKFFSSGINTWNNGGREMAIFCFIFSGLWPYIKLFVLAVLWFLPPKRLSVSSRKKALLWMDTFAKLSIFDLVTMLFFIAILLVFAGGPGGESMDSDGVLYSLKLIVVPGPAFYCFMIAQRISRSSSKYLLELQDLIETTALDDYEERKRVESEQGRKGETEIVVYKERIEGRYNYDDHELRLNTTDSTLIENEENESDGEEEVMDHEQDRNQCHNRQMIVSYSQHEQEDDDSTNDENKGYCRLCKHLGGVAGYRFTVVTIAAIGIIGCALMPSISLDTKGLWNIVESANTFQNAAMQYSVFEALSLVLLEARFVLDATSDYVGLGFLLVVVLVSAVIFPLIQFVSSALKWWNERKNQCDEVEAEATESVVLPDKVELPQYMKRIYLYRHLEIFVVSFVLAVWQLAAVSSYVLHFYCDLLGRMFDLLVYAGLTEKPSSDVQCFRTQMGDPLTLVIIIGGFFFLLASFLYQAFVQYKANRAAARRAVEVHGYSERFSTLWKSERRNNALVEEETFSDEFDPTKEGTRSTDLPFPFSDKIKTKLHRRAGSHFRRKIKMGLHCHAGSIFRRNEQESSGRSENDLVSEEFDPTEEDNRSTNLAVPFTDKLNIVLHRARSLFRHGAQESSGRSESDLSSCRGVGISQGQAIVDAEESREAGELA